MDAIPNNSDRIVARGTPAHGIPAGGGRSRPTPAQGTPMRPGAMPSHPPARTPAHGVALGGSLYNNGATARRTPVSNRTSGAFPRADLEQGIERVAYADAAQPSRRANVVPRTRSEIASRVLNVVIASVALVVLAPVLLLVALVVKLSSRGPAFYLQTRVGLDRRWNATSALYNRRTQDLGGRVFTIYKFRSMYTDAERHGKAVWATRNDPRVTPVGKVLRKTRLDELPQLINVLKGEMNIVGPRPERPSIFVRLREDIDGYAMRQRAKPGITGWAQINHSYDACIEDVKKKVEYDLHYLQHQSVWEDVKIMAKTIPVMLMRKGGW
jgi:lipopolysaccharide/colanic/teichoic acid biosynthesis glycosyltransferase